MEAGQGLRVVPLKNLRPLFGLYWPISTAPKGRCGCHVANVTFKGSPHETEKPVRHEPSGWPRSSQRPVLCPVEAYVDWTLSSTFGWCLFWGSLRSISVDRFGGEGRAHEPSAASRSRSNCSALVCKLVSPAFSASSSAISKSFRASSLRFNFTSAMPRLI